MSNHKENVVQFWGIIVPYVAIFATFDRIDLFFGSSLQAEKAQLSNQEKNVIQFWGKNVPKMGKVS